MTRFKSSEREVLILKTGTMTDAGHTANEISEALGISVSTVCRFRALAIQAAPKELVPVVLTTTPTVDTVSLSTPEGFRFEGLALQSAVELWRAIR